MKVTIDRATWRSGGELGYKTGRGDTELLNDEGFRCCLGFHASAAGVPDRFLHCGAPRRVATGGYDAWGDAWGEELTRAGLVKLIKLVRGKNWENTEFAIKAMHINDLEELSREERESRLIALAKKHGHEWTFVGEYSE